MEFWGIEVKPGQTVKYEANDNKYLHLSQATLGEGKKENKATESAAIYVNFDNKKLLIGTLSADKCPQISYDLVFEKGFELSHSWKNGSVFFVGYKVASEGSDDLSDDTDSDEFEFGDSLVTKESKEPKEVQAKAKAKADAKAPEPKKEEEEGDDSDEDEDYSEESESEDEGMLDGEADSDEGEEDASSEEEDEATAPKNGDQKKRSAESASKTPVAGKKAKVVDPSKSGGEGKKGGSGHPATPYPTKQVAKTPAVVDDKSKKQQQTPKSGGPVACPSCPKTFKDEHALKSHTLAKHPAP